MAAQKIYDPFTLWPQILEGIANGRSLSSILRQPGSPSYAWAKQQLRHDHELRLKYDQAIEDRGDRLAEELVELADTPIPEGLDGPSKSAWVQQMRLRIEARKWSASKLRPRAYGERLDVAVSQERISITTALEQARRRVLTIDAE